MRQCVELRRRKSCEIPVSSWPVLFTALRCAVSLPRSAYSLLRHSRTASSGACRRRLEAAARCSLGRTRSALNALRWAASICFHAASAFLRSVESARINCDHTQRQQCCSRRRLLLRTTQTQTQTQTGSPTYRILRRRPLLLCCRQANYINVLSRSFPSVVARKLGLLGYAPFTPMFCVALSCFH